MADEARAAGKWHGTSLKLRTPDTEGLAIIVEVSHEKSRLLSV